MTSDPETGCTCYDETTRKCPVPGHPVDEVEPRGQAKGRWKMTWYPVPVNYAAAVDRAIDDAMDQLQRDLATANEEKSLAVAAEREACAKIADIHRAGAPTWRGGTVAEKIAAEIRARGTK